MLPGRLRKDSLLIGICLPLSDIKEYLSLIPLPKWTRKTIDGKFLDDIISTIIYRKMRQALADTGNTMTRFFGRDSSLMYTRKTAGIKIPSSLGIEDFETIYLLKPMVKKQD